MSTDTIGQALTCAATSGGGTNSKSVMIKKDSTAPVISAPASLSVEANSADGAIVEYSASALDALTGDTIASCSPSSGSAFRFGQTTVSCNANDPAGNVATRTFTVTVADTVAPLVTIDATGPTEATSNVGAVVEFGAIAADAIDGEIPVSCTRSSGSTFAIGSTSVTCEATDAHGNRGSSTVDVVVRDTTGPELTVPTNFRAEAVGPDGAVVTFGTGAIDRVDGSTVVTCDRASGSTFSLGDTTVSCGSADSRGNRSTASFTVTVSDTTAPVLVVPDDFTVEATGPTGAVAEYTATASDLVDGVINPACDPPSRSAFGLGTTTVACWASDSAENHATGSFVISVVDTTPPTILAPLAIDGIEATSPRGAAVTFSVSASDLVSGDVAIECGGVVSGDVFAVGTTTVKCSSVDGATNRSMRDFNVTIVDTTDPALSVPATTVVEATGPAGATVMYSAIASDIVDGVISPVCTPASGTVFPLGDTAVNCTATDAAGNAGRAGFTVTVVDTTAPMLALPLTVSEEATGPTGAVAFFVASAYDLVDGARLVACDPSSGSTFPLGSTTVRCEATDATNHTASGTFTVSIVDTTAPVVTVPANITVDPTSIYGATVTFQTSASDIVDGPLATSCSPLSGSTFGFGTKEVTCSATDAAGNGALKKFTVTVGALRLSGFNSPVDMGGVINTVRSGSTVPLKFRVFAGSTELTDITAVKSLSVVNVSCASLGTNVTEDAIEEIAIGGTVLRYDTSGSQFIQNWQTPKNKAGSCYRVTVTTQDLSAIVANFKLK
ncbi:MAG: HYR domain-containing protein [Ilumatobacteraceae bacterium]